MNTKPTKPMILKRDYFYKDEIFRYKSDEITFEDKPFASRIVLVTFVRGITFKGDKIENGTYEKDAYYTDTKIYTELHSARKLTELGHKHDFPEYLL